MCAVMVSGAVTDNQGQADISKSHSNNPNELNFIVSLIVLLNQRKSCQTPRETPFFINIIIMLHFVKSFGSASLRFLLQFHPFVEQGKCHRSHA